MAVHSSLFESLFQKAEVGPQGPAGKDGNANVTSTNIVTVNPNQWSDNGYELTTQINVPGITQEILDKGVAMVYMSLATNTWSQLPYLEYNLYVEYVIQSGTLTIVVSTVDEEEPSVDIPVSFRVVIIPSSQKKANSNGALSNYNEVLPLINVSESIKASIN